MFEFGDKNLVPLILLRTKRNQTIGATGDIMIHFGFRLQLPAFFTAKIQDKNRIVFQRVIFHVNQAAAVRKPGRPLLYVRHNVCGNDKLLQLAALLTITAVSSDNRQRPFFLLAGRIEVGIKSNFAAIGRSVRAQVIILPAG
ncbi:MAG: hypothetical protein WC236_10180 [Gallionellaceae bacterium]|jgi:hypothetical protein